MEHCQFRQNPATGVMEDASLCAADCKDMCKRGCSHTPAKGVSSRDVGVYIYIYIYIYIYVCVYIYICIFHIVHIDPYIM